MLVRKQCISLHAYCTVIHTAVHRGSWQLQSMETFANVVLWTKLQWKTACACALTALATVLSKQPLNNLHTGHRTWQTRMETSYFNLIVTIGLTGEQEEDTGNTLNLCQQLFNYYNRYITSWFLDIPLCQGVEILTYWALFADINTAVWTLSKTLLVADFVRQCLCCLSYLGSAMIEVRQYGARTHVWHIRSSLAQTKFTVTVARRTHIGQHAVRLKTIQKVICALLLNANLRKNPCYTTDFICTESQEAQTNFFFSNSSYCNNYSHWMCDIILAQWCVKLY